MRCKDQKNEMNGSRLKRAELGMIQTFTAEEQFQQEADVREQVQE